MEHLVAGVAKTGDAERQEDGDDEARPAYSASGSHIDSLREVSKVVDVSSGL